MGQKAHEKRTDYCEPAANVACPGSGNMCAGNQCCPGVEASGNLTFPCPSATEVVEGCGSLTKVTDCIAPTTAAPTTVAATTSAKAALVQKAHEKRTDYCEPAASVACPGSGNMCAGNQCCPGVKASGNLTFPCPSATEVVEGCGSLTKVTDCIAPTTAAPTTVAATTSAKA